MRPGTTIALGAILVAVFAAVIIQLVVLGHGTSTCKEGTITADGSSGYVLPVPDRGLADQVGRSVTGCRVNVQAVAGVGFWAGQASNRVFVTVVGGGGRFVPKVGDKLDLSGTISPVGPDQLTGLSDADRALLQRQMEYVGALRVIPVG